jgi:hypothetical protein
MKKMTSMMLALVAMTTGVALNAEHKSAAVEATQVSLSSDELSFAEKLNEQNRVAFSDKFSAEQRKAVMTAVKNGAPVNEAVQKMFAAIEIKEAAAIAHAETSSEATSK